jgi:hypothetical protein
VPVCGVLTRRLDDPRLARMATFAGIAVIAYAAAVVLNARITAIDLVFTVALAALPPLAWLAAARAPGELRRLVVLLAAAATLWLLGSLMWYGYFLAAGSRIPTPPGPWDLLFLGAYTLAFGSLWVALRPGFAARKAALDTSVIVATGAGLGALIVAHGLSQGVSTVSLVTLVRPLFGVATLMVIASALLGRWDGLPLSIALIGLGQLFLTIGSFVYSVRSITGDFVSDNRWADLPWFAGLTASILAALVIVLRLDRPLTLRPPSVPGASRARVHMLAANCALVVAGASGLLAYRGRHWTVLAIELAVVCWVGIAMNARARQTVGELERAYARLDHAHAALERANDGLAAANVEIRSVHTAFEDVLVLVDERTHGRLSELIEDSGEDLARFLARYRRSGP